MENKQYDGSRENLPVIISSVYVSKLDKIRKDLKERDALMKIAERMYEIRTSCDENK